MSQGLWSFCVYLEAVSVLPQLRMIQKSKVRPKFLLSTSLLDFAFLPLRCHALLGCYRVGCIEPEAAASKRTKTHFKLSFLIFCAHQHDTVQVVERLTAHYVFALGLSRFFSCAHWLLQVTHCFYVSIENKLSK